VKASIEGRLLQQYLQASIAGLMAVLKARKKVGGSSEEPRT